MSTNVFLNSMRGQIPPYIAFYPGKILLCYERKANTTIPVQRTTKKTLEASSAPTLAKTHYKKEVVKCTRDIATLLVRKAALKNSSSDPLQAQQFLLKPISLSYFTGSSFLLFKAKPASKFQEQKFNSPSKRCSWVSVDAAGSQ